MSKSLEVKEHQTHSGKKAWSGKEAAQGGRWCSWGGERSAGGDQAGKLGWGEILED